MRPPLTEDLRIALFEFLYLLSRAKRLYRSNVKYATGSDDAWDELCALTDEAMLHTRQLLDDDSSTRGTRSGLKLFPGMGQDADERDDPSEVRARRALTMRQAPSAPTKVRQAAGRSLH